MSDTKGRPFAKESSNFARRHHLATLDGLRGIAAFIVVALHALDPFDLSVLTPHAGLAVDFFFCLSGFVVAYAYEERLLATMSLCDFGVARLIQLYPLILIGTVLGFIVFIAKSMTSQGALLTANVFTALICELLMVPTPIDIGAEGWGGYVPFNPPAWSLFFELFANFLYAASVRRLTKPILLLTVLLLAVIEAIQSYSVGGVDGGNHWHDLFLGFGRVLFPFLVGVFLFRCWNAMQLIKPRKLSLMIPITLLMVLLCPTPAPAKWIYEYLAVLVVFPTLIALGARDLPSPLVARSYLFLGRLSYPLYILHYPLVRLFSGFARSHSIHGAELWLLIIAEIASAVALSIIIMVFFDDPIRSWLTTVWRSWRHLNAPRVQLN